MGACALKKFLSRSQVEVLRLLTIERRCTTKTTHHGMISGATAMALERLGLVDVERTEEDVYVRYYVINDKGREALRLVSTNPSQEVETWPNLVVACASCKPLLSKTGTITVSRLWKPCARCGTKTIYRIREPLDEVSNASPQRR